MREIVVRTACRRDASAIVRVLQNHLPKESLCLGTCGSPKLVKFIKDVLSLQCATVSPSFYVATSGGYRKLVGACEARRIPRGIFINAISVRPTNRGAGVGTRLLWQAIGNACGRAPKDVVLDVGVNNTRARGWYERIGFVEQSRVNWFSARLRNSPVGGCWAEELEQCLISHKTYGFGKFRVISETGTSIFGMLGTKWFKLLDGEKQLSPQVEGLLAQLDPRRRLLFSQREGEVYSSGGLCVSSFIRLVADRLALLERLREIGCEYLIGSGEHESF